MQTNNWDIYYNLSVNKDAKKLCNIRFAYRPRQNISYDIVRLGQG